MCIFSDLKNGIIGLLVGGVFLVYRFNFNFLFLVCFSFLSFLMLNKE